MGMSLGSWEHQGFCDQPSCKGLWGDGKTRNCTTLYCLITSKDSSSFGTNTCIQTVSGWSPAELDWKWDRGCEVRSIAVRPFAFRVGTEASLRVAGCIKAMLANLQRGFSPLFIGNFDQAGLALLTAKTHNEYRYACAERLRDPIDANRMGNFSNLLRPPARTTLWHTCARHCCHCA